MKALIAGLMVLCLSFASSGAVVYEQPANTGGGWYKSSWYAPDGLDGDEYTWDNFTLASGAAISEIHWRGCYAYTAQSIAHTSVTGFKVSIYRSIAAGSQPDVGTGGRLASYTVSAASAGETAAGSIAGIPVYEYAFTLAAPFQAVAGTKYWIQIEASQGLNSYGWPPDWSLCAATGGDGGHFRQITGSNYANIGGDLAFSLYTSGAATVNIAASVSPAGAGTVAGAGSYPVGSTASLTAAANTGWGFVNWTENAASVSSNTHYSFTASVDRTLVANFAPAYTITTASYPVYGGTAAGGGSFLSGSSVTVTATPNHGFVFAGWSDGSMDQTHAFPASADMIITAFFDSAPLAVTYDFDNAPAMTPFPIALTANGLTAQFSGGYSIQQAGTMGLVPVGFSGLCVYPSSIFASDLLISFSEPLTDFSILYSTQELACDTSATMRVTAYLGAAFVGTNTTTAPVPGTWPSGTLTITPPGVFDNVVVHYDARPPTCQDYGVIFLADNVTVTRACAAPSILAPPLSVETCPWGAATFAVTATGPGLTYQWQRETALKSGTFVAIADGPTGAWDGNSPGVGGVVSGATTSAITVAADAASATQLSAAHSVRYRCVVSAGGGACGSVSSDAARLIVCPADFDCSGGLAVADIFAFLNAWFGGAAHADFNGGGLAVQDIFDYLNAWFAGCH